MATHPPKHPLPPLFSHHPTAAARNVDLHKLCEIYKDNSTQPLAARKTYYAKQILYNHFHFIVQFLTFILGN